MGHGEVFKDTGIANILDMAGYEPVIIDDLINQDIPENCRLLVSYNPTADFMAADSISDISEIEKIDKFLEEKSHSLMVFMSPSSAVLPNLEDYLALWGISFGRYTDAAGNITPCTIKDTRNALTGDGLTIVGEYETLGFGAKFTEDMRSVKNPRRVVFKNAMPILLSEEYEVSYEKNEDSGEYYSLGYKSLGNGYNRRVAHIFTASSTAGLMADGKQVARTDPTNPYGLLTVSMQYRATQEDSFVQYYKGNESAAFSTQSSYVMACGSIEAFTNAILNSGTYGNSEVMLYAMNEMGKEPIPVSLPFAVFSQTEIESLTVNRANAFTVSLAIIPAAIVFGVGTFVIIRRKRA